VGLGEGGAAGEDEETGAETSYFGRISLGVTMGIAKTIIMIGQIVGLLFAGFMADATDSSVTGFTTLEIWLSRLLVTC
jgi:hypothetical protein